MPRSDATNAHGGITVETELTVVDVNRNTGRVWLRTASGETFSVCATETFAISVPVFGTTT